MVAAIGRAVGSTILSTICGAQRCVQWPRSRQRLRSGTLSDAYATRCCPLTTPCLDTSDFNIEGSGPERCVSDAEEEAVLDLQATATSDALLHTAEEEAAWDIPAAVTSDATLTAEEEAAGSVPAAVPSNATLSSPAGDPSIYPSAMNPATKIPKDILRILRHSGLLGRCAGSQFHFLAMVRL